MVTGSKALRVSAKGASAYSPLRIPGLVFLLVYKDTVAQGAFTHDKTSPSSRSILTSAPDWRVNLSGPWYGSGSRYNAYDGGTLTLSGYTTPGNNGRFVGFTPNANEIKFPNQAGVAAETVGAGVGTAVVQSAGYGVSCVDRRSGLTFSSSFNLNAAYGYDTLISASPTLCAFANPAREPMALASSAVGGLLNGTGPFTLWHFLRPKQIAFSGQPTHHLTVQGPGGTSLVRFQNLGGASQLTLTIQDGAGVASTFTATIAPAIALNVWQLLSVVYTTGLAKFYVDGVQVGSASGTDRARVALDYMYTGMQPGTLGHTGVAGAAASAMAPADLVKLTNWCRKEYPAA